MHEATLRIEGQGAFADATRDVHATIELWCNDHCDLLRVQGDPDGVLRERVNDLIGVQESMTENGNEVLITESCLERHEATMIDTFLSRHNCLMLPPLRYERGYKTCRVLALNPENLTEFYHDILDRANVEVKSKREVTALGGTEPLSNAEREGPSLSPRQRETIITAYELGYYDIPRETTTEEIADAIGVQRRTAEQHIRRAEDKLVESVIPSISRYQST